MSRSRLNEHGRAVGRSMDSSNRPPNGLVKQPRPRTADDGDGPPRPKVAASSETANVCENGNGLPQIAPRKSPVRVPASSTPDRSPGAGFAATMTTSIGSPLRTALVSRRRHRVRDAGMQDPTPDVAADARLCETWRSRFRLQLGKSWDALRSCSLSRGLSPPQSSPARAGAIRRDGSKDESSSRRSGVGVRSLLPARRDRLLPGRHRHAEPAELSYSAKPHD
jgi:hypothetical protein